MSTEQSNDKIKKLTHGNYNVWAQRVQAHLMELRVWRLCNGNKTIPTNPTPPVTMNMMPSEVLALNRDFQEDTHLYNEALCHNDKAIGTIAGLLKLDQLQHTEGKTSALDIWDTLKKKHANMHTGLAAFYIKVGMLTKQYTKGDNMHMHLSFFTTENCKLGSKGFDDEFLTQVMLMSLPHDSAWETLVITLLQSTSDTKPLTTTDVTSRLMQEFHRISGTYSSDSALLTSLAHHKSKPGKKKKSSEKCSFCSYLGHNEHESRKKKKEEEEKAKSEGNRGRSWDKSNAKANLASHDDSDSETLVKANFASVHAEFPA